MEFHESLAKYYIQWFFDCHGSANWCKARGNKGDKELEKQYLDNASKYLTIIMENWDKVSKE